MALVKITQERSKIRCMKLHKRTLVALGLRRINHSVVHEDTPQIRGMVDLVRYLVRIEPAVGEAAKAGSSSARKQTRSAPGAKMKAGATKGRGVAKASRTATRAKRKRAPRS
jgi:large subunit ribosomal protein L30